MIKTEATGKTLDSAVEKALQELGLTREQVDVNVLQEGNLLKQFKVEVVKKATDGERISDFLQNVLDKMGYNKYVVEFTEDEQNIKLNILSANSGLESEKGGVIGYRGEVLDALQYLCSLLVSDKNGSFKRVTLDSEGYRAKREKTLEHLAKNLEQKVKRTGKAVVLEPMNPYERRIIHTTLQNSKYVSTESEGVGNTRHVVVSPKLQGDVLNSPNAPRKTLNFVYRSDKKR